MVVKCARTTFPWLDYLLLISLPLIMFEIILGTFSSLSLFSFCLFWKERQSCRFRCHWIIERQNERTNERTIDCLRNSLENDARLNVFLFSFSKNSYAEINKYRTEDFLKCLNVCCSNTKTIRYVLHRLICIVEIIIIITTGIGRNWKVFSHSFHCRTKIQCWRKERTKEWR